MSDASYDIFLTACPVFYLPIEEVAKLIPAIPSATLGKKLTYVTEVASVVPTQGNSGSDFCGYPTLKQRDDNFNVQVSMHVHYRSVSILYTWYLTSDVFQVFALACNGEFLNTSFETYY